MLDFFKKKQQLEGAYSHSFIYATLIECPLCDSLLINSGTIVMTKTQSQGAPGLPEEPDK